MNTRRYPRTMSEAFGPYVDNRLEPMRDKPLEPVDRRHQDMALVIVAVAAIALMLTLFALGY